jgi:hypothetical protein
MAGMLRGWCIPSGGEGSGPTGEGQEMDPRRSSKTGSPPTLNSELHPRFASTPPKYSPNVPA